jgi:hypothetical protein
LHEYEAADVSLLFLFTKEDADAALAVRLRTAEGIDIPTPDDTDSQVPDDDAKPAIPFEYPSPIAPRQRGRPRKNLALTQLMQFLSAKEQADFQLEAQLRTDSKIRAPGAPFEESDATKIDNLMVAGVLKPEPWDAAKHFSIRIFKS